MAFKRNIQSLNKMCLVLIVIFFIFYMEMSRKIMQYNLNYKNLTNYSSQIVKKDIATIKKNKQKINIFDLSQKLIPETV